MRMRVECTSNRSSPPAESNLGLSELAVASQQLPAAQLILARLIVSEPRTGTT